MCSWFGGASGGAGEAVSACIGACVHNIILTEPSGPALPAHSYGFIYKYGKSI
jgi:hypothetical protein